MQIHDLVSIGTVQEGDRVTVKVRVRSEANLSQAQVSLRLGGLWFVPLPPTDAAEWKTLSFTATAPSGTSAGEVKVRLSALPLNGVTNAYAYFDDVQVRKTAAATLATGQPNLWPDPGFESYLAYGDGVEDNNSRDAQGKVLFDKVSIEDLEGREGLHALRVGPGGRYARTVTGLEANRPYVFSVWRNAGSGWTREIGEPQNAVDGSLTIELNTPGLYDQAELIQGNGTTVPESWIPENRLGRVDWFITDHLGSTKLLIDQNGTHRFTGDDDPFGINLRSFGDKDSHRYTGQILDEEQGVYYYGARYYLPEIGRFLSGDPNKVGFSPYLYGLNAPIIFIDPDGRAPASLKAFGGYWVGVVQAFIGNPVVTAQYNANELQSDVKKVVNTIKNGDVKGYLKFTGNYIDKKINPIYTLKAAVDEGYHDGNILATSTNEYDVALVVGKTTARILLVMAPFAKQGAKTASPGGLQYGYAGDAFLTNASRAKPLSGTVVSIFFCKSASVGDC